MKYLGYYKHEVMLSQYVNLVIYIQKCYGCSYDI